MAPFLCAVPFKDALPTFAMTDPRPLACLSEACMLPVAWAHQAAWRVLEVAGTRAGNFLHTWAAWRADPQRCKMLHYVVIIASHSAFSQPVPEVDEVHADLAAELALQSWGLLPGMHRLAFDSGQVLLTVCVGEPETFLRKQAWAFDSIFLQGLPERDIKAPTHLWKSLARCCAPNALLASCGDAPPPAKVLAECGFTQAEPVLKGKVWHCRYAPSWQSRTQRVACAPTSARCIVIGAGLSGAAVAASLARRGWQVTVLEAAGAPAAGASGLPVGLFAPHVSTDDNPVARISRAGVRATWEQCTLLLKRGTDWLDGGVLEKRPPGNLGLPGEWSSQNASCSEPAADWGQAASQEDAIAAGLPARSEAVQHRRAGWVKPAQLVRALLAQPGVRFQAHGAVHQLERLPASTGSLWRALDVNGAVLGEAELVVVACGPASGALLQTAGLSPLPLDAFRGQLSWGMQQDAMQLPQNPVNGHGALIAQVPVNGRLAWHAGSTFERERTELPVSAQDQRSGHQENFQHLSDLLPKAAQALTSVFAAGAPALQHWAGVRCATPDRHPLVGPVSPKSHPGLWLCTGMGSRGLSRAVLCGELLAAQLHGEPLPLPTRLAASMAADRFQRRPK